ncbi:MAG: thiamine pyrophosphate-dependent enzyme [Candidatus Brocadiaceae bacterium]|nr:thiamine pyrophosphate-dependent enzyme [Candidatus Brocadiaceae bacterium]
MKIITGGELLLDVLVRCGIRHIFSISGEHIGTVYDAFKKFPEINFTIPRCETSAAIMASGYTAATGCSCVTMSTVGAGVIYEVSGLSKAWFTYLPVLSIAPQLQSWKIKPHQENLQGCNQDEIFFPITKWNTIVYTWERIPQMIYRAFREAWQGIPGPVHIDIPVDVLFRYKMLTKKKKQKILPPAERTMYRGAIRGDSFYLKEACKMIRKSERPLIIVGQGFGRPGRYQDMTESVNRLGIPVITTVYSSGVFCGSDICYAGDASLFMNSNAGMKLLSKADLFIVAGIDPDSERMLSAMQNSSYLKGIVQIEIDPSAFADSIPCLCPVHADPQSSFSYFEREMKTDKNVFSVWKDDFSKNCDLLAVELSKECKDSGKIFDSIKNISSDNDIFIVDGKELSLAASCFLRKAVYKNLFIMDDRDISGAGLPFAIGAAIGNPDNNIVLICDTDSLFHHIGELQPASLMKLKFTIICVDNVSSNSNVADTTSVLEGMGCYVKEIDPLSIKKEGLSKVKAEAINAWVIKDVTDRINEQRSI